MVGRVSTLDDVSEVKYVNNALAETASYPRAQHIPLNCDRHQQFGRYAENTGCFFLSTAIGFPF